MIMNFSKSDGDFLARYQSLLFSEKLEKGTPSERADVLRHTISHLQYAKISGVSDESLISKLLTQYQYAYSNIVDSFDEKTGLNNFAEGALSLCSGNKNESQSWKSSLTVDGVLKMPAFQQLVKDTKISKDKVLPPDIRNEKIPLKKTSMPPNNLRNTQKQEMKSTKFSFTRQAPAPPPNTDSRSMGGDMRPPPEQILNMYDDNVRPQSHNSTSKTGNMFDGNVRPLAQSRSGASNTGSVCRPGGYGSYDTNNENDPPYMNRKPNLFGSGRGTGKPWQNERSQSGYGQNMDNTAGKRKMADPSTEDDNDRPSMAGNAFRTAKQQLAIDNQKKYGGGSQQNRGSLNNAAYGTGKKSLGPRRGLNSKFVPPVINREDMDTDGNQAANTITRAVLKTGGSDESSMKFEGLDEDKLKGIEPKMIELIMNEIMDTGPELTWDDVAGLEFAKKTIKEIVVWPMLRPDIFTGLRGPPKGLLLFGPPGTGKTLIGKCIASQSKSTFFCISASSLTSKWVGEGEKMVRALFAVARAQQPAVVFIDEIDSLLTQRTDGENEASRRIKTEFLVQLDGASTSSDDRILVIGATNRPQEIDEAARRRFVKRLYIPLPEYNARKTIIVNLLKKQSYMLDEKQLEQICTRTEGFSGADMATLCREAALGPIRDMSFGDIEHITADQVRPIQFCDFTDALDTVRPSVSDKDLDLYLDWNKTFGSGSR